MKRLLVFVFAVALFSSCIKSRAKSIEGTYTVTQISIYDTSGHSESFFDNSEHIVEIQKERNNRALVIASLDDSLVFNEELELSRARSYRHSGFFGTKQVFYVSLKDKESSILPNLNYDTTLYCYPNLETGELTLSFYNDLGMFIRLDGDRIE